MKKKTARERLRLFNVDSDAKRFCFICRRRSVVFFPAICFVNTVKVLRRAAAALRRQQRDALCGAPSHILLLFSWVKTDGHVGGTMQEPRINIHTPRRWTQNHLLLLLLIKLE